MTIKRSATKLALAKSRPVLPTRTSRYRRLPTTRLLTMTMTKMKSWRNCCRLRGSPLADPQCRPRKTSLRTVMRWCRSTKRIPQKIVAKKRKPPSTPITIERGSTWTRKLTRTGRFPTFQSRRCPNLTFLSPRTARPRPPTRVQYSPVHLDRRASQPIPLTLLS